MNWRPSSLPALSGCPAFESAGENQWTLAGTNRDKALQSHWNGDDTLLETLPQSDQESVRWVADQIRLYAPLSNYPIEFQKRVTLTMDDFSEVPGTMDAACGRMIIDQKSRPRDYRAQMAAYTIGMYQDSPIPRERGGCEIMLLFTETRYVARYTLTEEEAWAIINPIIENQSTEPTPCEHCSFCSKILVCQAYTKRAEAVRVGREDWSLEQYHPSQIVDPAQMAKAIRLAKALRKWCDTVDFCKKKMAITENIPIPGFYVKETDGDREITELARVQELLGLPGDAFTRACSCSVTALEAEYAAHYKVTKAQAKRDINSKLESIITRKPEKSLKEE